MSGLRGHFVELGGLQVEELEEVEGEAVDLVGHRGQALRRVPLRLVKCISLVLVLNLHRVQPN